MRCSTSGAKPCCRGRRDGERFGLAWLDLAAGASPCSKRTAMEHSPPSSSVSSPPSCCFRKRSRRRRHRAAPPSRPTWYFELSSASRLLTDQLGTLDLKGFGGDELPLAISAAGACFSTCATRRRPQSLTSARSPRRAHRRADHRRDHAPQSRARWQHLRQRCNATLFAVIDHLRHLDGLAPPASLAQSPAHRSALLNRATTRRCAHRRRPLRRIARALRRHRRHRAHSCARRAAFGAPARPDACANR